MVISQTGTTISHAMGYPLTSEKGLKHGMATVIFIPWELETAGDSKSKIVMGIFDEGFDDFFHKVGLNLKVAVSRDEIEKWSETVSRSGHIKSTPGTYNREILRTGYATTVKKYCGGLDD